jgi:hypothetical protein
VTHTQANEADALLKERVICPLKRVGKVDDAVAGSCIFDNDELYWSLRGAGDDDLNDVIEGVGTFHSSCSMCLCDALMRWIGPVRTHGGIGVLLPMKRVIRIRHW